MKMIALSALLSLLFIAPVFSQTKKQKIKELLSFTYSKNNKMMDMLDKIIDPMSTQMVHPTKKKEEQDTTIKGWAKNALPQTEPQLFEDTAAYNKKERIKVGLKKMMVDVMTDMKKEAAPIYDTAFTEAEIDKALAFNKSEAGKKYKEESEKGGMDMAMSINSKDTSYKTHVFLVGRKEKLDTLVGYTMPKEKYMTMATNPEFLKQITGSIFNNAKDTMQRKEMIRATDSIQKSMVSSPDFHKKMEEIFEEIKLKKEVIDDKNLSDKAINDLIAHYKDPEARRITEKTEELSTKIMMKIMPKMMQSMMALMQEK